MIVYRRLGRKKRKRVAHNARRLMRYGFGMRQAYTIARRGYSYK